MLCALHSLSQSLSLSLSFLFLSMTIPLCAHNKIEHSSIFCTRSKEHTVVRALTLSNRIDLNKFIRLLFLRRKLFEMVGVCERANMLVAFLHWAPVPIPIPSLYPAIPRRPQATNLSRMHHSSVYESQRHKQSLTIIAAIRFAGGSTYLQDNTEIRDCVAASGFIALASLTSIVCRLIAIFSSFHWTRCNRHHHHHIIFLAGSL